MKTTIQQLILGLCFACCFVACQKDVDNSVPATEKKLTHKQQEFKNTLLKNTLAKNNKIWISNPLELGEKFSWILLERDYFPTFFIGFDFKEDGTANIYATAEYPYQTVSSGSLLSIPDNPNTYKVGGILRTELTFLSKGILSDLKRLGTIGFDYHITEFSDTEIKMDTYYTNGSNIAVTLHPYDFDDFKTFTKAAEVFYKKNGVSGNPRSGWNGATMTISEKSTGTEVAKNVTTNSFYAFASLFEQVYDKDRNLFLFRFIDLTQAQVDQIVTGFFIIGQNNYASPGRFLRIDEYYSRDIQYLSPTRVTDTQMVFDTYGKTATDDQKYEVIFDRKFELVFKDDEDRHVEIELPQDGSAPAVIENNDVLFEVVLNDDVPVDGQASIIADDNLVAEYNKNKSTNYLTVPDQWYTISNGNITISSGETTTEPTQVTFNNDANFQSGQYVLPLRLTSSSLTLKDDADRVYITLNVFNNNVDSENPVIQGTKVDRSNWTIKVSSTDDDDDDYNKENLLDGDVGTGWLSKSTDNNVELILDAGTEITVKGFEFSLLSTGSSLQEQMESLKNNPTKVDIYSSSDGTDWSEYQGRFKRDVPTELDDISRISFYNPVTARYFRFEMTSSASVTGVSEINAVE